MSDSKPAASAEVPSALREALVEVAFAQIAAEKVLTVVMTAPHRAAVPLHWRAEAEERARPWIETVAAVRPTEDADALRAEVERLRERMPCDGGCNVNDGPEEHCSLHGRPVRWVWHAADEAYRWAAAAERERDAARAEVARLREGLTALDRDLDAGRADGTIYTYGQVQARLRALLAEEKR